MKHAPAELAQIGLDPHVFVYSDNKSWRGPCPSCGGTRRFVMFTDHEWPLWNGFCDQCNTVVKAWEKVRVKADPAHYAAFKAQQEADEAQRIARRAAKLAEFTTQELWDELRSRMTIEHIDWWESQGVPVDIQRRLSIGYKADKMYYDNGEEKHSPAYTIPWFKQDFTFETMQYRLMNADPKNRYRFEYDLPGGGSCYYMSDPAEPIKDKVIICEGAKKAIVTWYWLAPHGFTVLAASSNNTLRPALEATKDCGLRYLILDPGSEKKAFETAKEHSLKAVYLPEKIDDMVLANLITREDFEKVLATL